MNNYQPYFDVADLIAKHIHNDLTATEEIELSRWREQSAGNEELFQKLINEQSLHDRLEDFPATDHRQAWENIRESIGLKQNARPVPLLRRLYPYAAAILVLATLSLTIAHLTYRKPSTPALAINRKDIQPGTNKATLTLADGSKILLEKSGAAKIAQQKNIDANKTHHGELVYRAETASATTAAPAIIIPTNMISTPRGGQYAVVLSDGTKVWLNAASSLKYPTTFSGAQRQVELTGEAYFEVAKNPARPFLVKTASQTVEVLGTHFNINSYTDEKATTTTLLEGSVRVTGTAAQTAIQLKPGQQAVNNNKEISLAANPEINEAMAWRSGKFVFNHADLKAIMRQLSRWYDVDIEYQGEITEKHYQGHVSRDVPVSQIFQILKTSGINFTISGGKIIVRS